VAPFDERRFMLDGPPCRAARDAVTPLMMALHELCTNATKYGALSTDDGGVWLRWMIDGKSPAPTITLLWEEHGGPPVSVPQHRGLGSRLLAAHGGLSAVTLDWRPQGLRCEMSVLCAD
jgi:two-component sensor histidine kinase